MSPSDLAAPAANAILEGVGDGALRGTALGVHPAYNLSVCPAEEAQDVLSRGETDFWLGAAESAVLGSLKLEKRRRDWLAGRIAAKRAIGRRLNQEPHAIPIEPAAIEILNESSGRPYCRLSPEALSSAGTDPASAPPPARISFSISHSDEGGLCAVAADFGPIGADWEAIAPRSEKLLSYYAAEEERSPLLASSAAAQTRLWTLKEAVLKFLGMGLALDPREIRCLETERGARAQLRGSARRLWAEMGGPPIALEHFVLGGSAVGLAFPER